MSTESTSSDDTISSDDGICTDDEKKKDDIESHCQLVKENAIYRSLFRHIFDYEFGNFKECLTKWHNIQQSSNYDDEQTARVVDKMIEIKTHNELYEESEAYKLLFDEVYDNDLTNVTYSMEDWRDIVQSFDYDEDREIDKVRSIIQGLGENY